MSNRLTDDEIKDELITALYSVLAMSKMANNNAMTSVLAALVGAMCIDEETSLALHVNEYVERTLIPKTNDKGGNLGNFSVN